MKIQETFSPKKDHDVSTHTGFNIMDNQLNLNGGVKNER
jgi:hypothetical protein